MNILITGTAGFIGNALSLALAMSEHNVDGIDNINNYYDPRLKIARLKRCGFDFGNLPHIVVSPISGARREPVVVDDIPFGVTFRSSSIPSLSFTRIDLSDFNALSDFFAKTDYDVVINLAAQAGVRYSIENPRAYVETNIVGFLNMLECARINPPAHFIYASSSSVYGESSAVPFNERERTLSPVSMYAATKMSDELMAHAYSKIYGLKTTGLRFFTVYGPWGRPDMAPSLFADAIADGMPLKVFNNGCMSRDFTYIDDIVEAIVAIVEKGHSGGEPAVYNIGCGHPEKLGDFIELLEQSLGKKAVRQLLPMQKGDVSTTWADTSALKRDYGVCPRISLKDGIKKFAEWKLSCDENFNITK